MGEKLERIKRLKAKAAAATPPADREPPIVEPQSTPSRYAELVALADKSGPFPPGEVREVAPGVIRGNASDLEPKKAEPLLYACGHPAKHKVSPNQLCPPCTQAHRNAKFAKKAAAMNAKTRLPDGARFNVSYCAATQSWSGHLEIPECPLFEGSASGVFRLLQNLDGQYHGWKKGQK